MSPLSWFQRIKQAACIALALWILSPGNHYSYAADPELTEALTLDRQGFIAESIPHWHKFLQTSPKTDLQIYAQLKISIAYAKTGSFGEAVKAAQSLAEAHPAHYDAQFNLGNMLSATHQFTEAGRAYNKAADLNKEEGLAFVGLGLSLFGEGKPDEAVKVLRKVRKLFKSQKNISWYQHVRIMIGQLKGFAPYPPSFSELWLTNNLNKVRETYQKSVFREFEKQLGL